MLSWSEHGIYTPLNKKDASFYGLREGLGFVIVNIYKVRMHTNNLPVHLYYKYMSYCLRGDFG